MSKLFRIPSGMTEEGFQKVYLLGSLLAARGLKQDQWALDVVGKLLSEAGLVQFTEWKDPDRGKDN